MSLGAIFSLNIEPYNSFGHSRTASPFSFAVDEYTIGFLLTRFLVLFYIPTQDYKYIPIPASVLEVRAVYPNHTGEYLCLVEVNEDNNVQLSVYFLLKTECVSTIILSDLTQAILQEHKSQVDVDNSVDSIAEVHLPIQVQFSVTSKVLTVHLPLPVSLLLLINWQQGTIDTVHLQENTKHLALCPFSGTAMISTLENQSIRLWRSIDGTFKDFTPTKMRATIPTQPVMLSDGTETTVSIRGCFWMGSSLSAAITNIGDVIIFAGPSFVSVIPALRSPTTVPFFKDFKASEYYSINGEISAYCVYDNLLVLGTDKGELICLEFCLSFDMYGQPEPKSRAQSTEKSSRQSKRSRQSSMPTLVAADEPETGSGPGFFQQGDIPLFSNLESTSAPSEESSKPMDITGMAALFEKTACTSLGGSEVAIYPHKVLGTSNITNTRITYISCNTPEYALIETSDSTVHLWPLNFDSVLVIDETTLSLVQKNVGSKFGSRFAKKKSRTSSADAPLQPRMAFTAEVEKEKQAMSESIEQYMRQQNADAVQKFHELISDAMDAEIYDLTIASDKAIIDTAGIQYLITLQKILEILQEDAPFEYKVDAISTLAVEVTGTGSGELQQSDQETTSHPVATASDVFPTAQGSIDLILKGISDKLAAVQKLDTERESATPSPRTVTTEADDDGKSEVAEQKQDTSGAVDAPLKAIMNDVDVDGNTHLNRFTSVNLWSMLLQGFPVPSLPPPSIFQQSCGPRATLAAKSLLKPGIRIGGSLPLDFGSLLCLDASDVCDVFVVGSSNGYIYAGRTSTGRIFAYKKFSAAIQTIKLYPNGLFGVAQYSEGVGLFNISDQEISEAFFLAEPGLQKFALSHGGGYIALSTYSNKRYMVKVRSFADFSILTELSAYQSPIVHMEFVPGDTMLVTVERDGLVSGYKFFTRQRLFECKLRGVCLTSAFIAVGRQIPSDVVCQASMHSILNKEEDAGMCDDNIMQQIPGGIASSLQSLKPKVADESQIPYDMLIKQGSVIDSVCYEPIVVFCYDQSGKTYEIISNQILYESQSMEPYPVNLLTLVPPPVSQEVLMSNRYIEKLVGINRMGDSESAVPASNTVTGATFGIEQEELVTKGNNSEMLDLPSNYDIDYYAHKCTTHEIAETNIENRIIDLAMDIEAITADNLEARLNQSKKDYFTGTISMAEQDTTVSETRDLVNNIIKMSSKSYSQRPISLSEPEGQFLLGFTSNGWVTAFDWPIRAPRAVYRRRLHGTDIVATRLIRGSTLFTLSSDELIISHVRFLIPASALFANMDKTQQLRAFKTMLHNDEDLDSVLLKLPITQYIPVMPFDHCSRTTAYGSSIDNKIFNLIINTADIWASTDYRSALIKESTRDKADKITARISNMKSTIATAIQQLDQRNSGGDKENAKLEADINISHETALAQTQEQYQTRIEQLRKDIVELEIMLQGEAERYESTRSSLQQRFDEILAFEEKMRIATMANLNAQIDQQDQVLSKMEETYGEELRQIKDELSEATKAVREIGENAVEREKNAAATLKGWESMQRRRIATLVGQGQQLNSECDMELKKVERYNEELAKVTVEIEMTRKVLQKKDQQVAIEERKIHELNKEVKRLGKIQYILTNQISSLKSEINPRDELIMDMRERVDGLSEKLENLGQQWAVINSSLESEQAAVKELSTQISDINRLLHSRERGIENLKKDIISLITEYNSSEWINNLKTLWKKYQPLYDELSKIPGSKRKDEEGDTTVVDELLEHKAYLNSRISTLYEELRQESTQFTTAQAFCLDENSALLTESHRLRDENISLKTQLQRVVAMLEEIRLSELSMQTQRRMRERAARQNQSPSFSERSSKSLGQPTISTGE